MATYLVTGGCGFIGGHLVRSLLAEGHRIQVLDDLSSGRRSRVPSEVRILEGSVCDASAVKDAVAGVDGIFHLAAIASVERCTREVMASHAVNLDGALLVFLEAARVEVPVIYASSAAVYGAQQGLPIAEDALPMPSSTYGADKLACEHHARALSLTHGLRSTGLRFFNVYGEGQDPSSPYSGVISIFGSRIESGLPVTIFGDGKATRDFVAVEDVVNALLRCMTKLSSSAGTSGGAGSHRVFNVCTGVPTSVNELFRMISELHRSESLPCYASARAGEISHSLGDPTTLRLWCGGADSTRLSEGLARLFPTSNRES